MDNSSPCLLNDQRRSAMCMIQLLRSSNFATSLEGRKTIRVDRECPGWVLIVLALFGSGLSGCAV